MKDLTRIIPTRHAMGLHGCKLPLPGVGVPPSCVSTALLLLLLVFFLLSCSHLKPCTCTPFDKVPGFLHLRQSSRHSSCSGWDKVSGDLRSYINTYYPHTKPDDPGFFLTFYSMPINGSSFSILLTMSSIYKSNSVPSKPPNSSLLFSIQPALDPDLYEFYPFSPLDTYRIFQVSNTSSVVNVSGGNVSATIYEAQRGVWVQIEIGIEQAPAPGGGSSSSGYSVWIDYYHDNNSVWVYVDTGSEAAASKPADAAANATLGSPCVMPEAASLGFRSSVGQLEQLHTLNTIIIHDDIDGNDTAGWNWTATKNNSWDSAVDLLQPNCYPNHTSFYFPLDVPRRREKSHEKKTIIILSSVLGSAAVTAAISAAVASFCFNSRQRRWRKEQDKLTKVMQSLPGVPAQVDFTVFESMLFLVLMFFYI